MSFHDYFFTAPGASVPRPFVGFDNYATVLSDPDVRRSFFNVGVFLVINVPLTVGLSLLLANALNAAIRGPDLLPGQLLRALRHGQRRGRRGVAVPVLQGRHGQPAARQLAPDPSWLVNATLAMPLIAIFVTWKQLGFYILLYLAALQNVPKELYESASVDGANAWQKLRNVTIPGVRPATALVVILAIITGANLFTEPYLLTNGGGPDGASASPVLVMYQKGIEQGNPDVASAIGVILVLGVLVISLISRRVLERD